MMLDEPAHRRDFMCIKDRAEIRAVRLPVDDRLRDTASALGERRQLEHPRLQGPRRWNLVTRDAHALYRHAGFSSLAHPERHMERTRPDFYRNS